MKLLLLGSNGFIGKQLGIKLEQSYEVIKVNRLTNLKTLTRLYSNFDVVVNCAASKPSVDLSEAKHSNYEYPRLFFDRFNISRWIQIDSYYQLQIPMGAKDAYSLTKQEFCDFLDLQAKETPSPSVHHLYIPHIFGEGDRPNRLISSFIASSKKGLPFGVRNGERFIPLLYISDAVSGIERFINNPHQSVASCTPFWYGRVRHLVELLIARSWNTTIDYDHSNDIVDSSFSPVEFPNQLEFWRPKMGLDEFLMWVKFQIEQA